MAGLWKFYWVSVEFHGKCWDVESPGRFFLQNRASSWLYRYFWWDMRIQIWILGFRKRHTKLNSPPIEVSLFFVCLLSFSFPLGNIPVLIKASLIDSVAGRFIFHPLSCLLWAYSLLIILPNKKSIYSSNIHWKILRSQQRKFLWLNHGLHGKGIRKWRKQGNENPFCLWGRKNRYKQTLRMNSLFFASHFYTLEELMLP